MNRLFLARLAVLLALVPAAALADGVVGPEACRACHPQAVASWEKSAHARAESTLGEKAKDPSCLACHAPGKADGLAGVSCESCHGPGEHYAKSYVMRDRELARAVGLEMPGEKECRACHDAASPSLAPFRFDHALVLIEHGKADRAARHASPKPAAASPKAPAPAAPAAPAWKAPKSG